VSADYRVVQAREFLDTIRPYKVANRPLSVLRREDAELRRILGQLLTLVDDYEYEERREAVTHLTVWGGAHITPEGVLVLAQALADALAWRSPETCRDCTRGALCDDHAEDVRRRRAYQDLAAELGIEVNA